MSGSSKWSLLKTFIVRVIIVRQITKIESSLLAGMSLAFALLVACSGEDASSSVDAINENPFVITTDTIVDRHGDTIIRNDTGRKQIDTVMHITEKGETLFVAETVYVGLDTTLHWVGNSALVITEIMTVNLDWTDEDGDDGAWIEIYNAGSENANLKGYSLVENADKSRKWVFGNEVIKAKSFRIVFCDKKNHAVAAGAKDTTLKRKDGEEYYAHYRTHTNWKLNNKGGTVYLIDPYYAIRDSVDYPELKSGISWGIMDGGVWKYFDKPTPEERNTESKAYDDLVPEIDMSAVTSGFYSDKINLNPPSMPEGVKVRCTKDGSEPTSSSPEFNEKITITESMSFRCAAYKSGSLGRQVITKSFFVNESVNMPVVAISVDPEFFTKHYIPKKECGSADPKSCPAGLMEDVEDPVHVMYFADGSKSSGPAWEIDAGISLMGGWSRVADKKSVAITMHEEYQDGRLKYPLFETRKSDSVFKAFNLRNNGNRFVSDYIADAMAGAILEGSGVDYQRSRQVVVFYNGKYYGIHDMRERFNRAYVETNYGINSSSVEMVKQVGGVDKITASGDGSIDSYLQMLYDIADTTVSVAENFERAKKLIDVGNFADYMAAEIYYHNGDWPNNNVRAWRSPDQPWKFMVYDVDHGFDWAWGVNNGEFGQDNNMFAWIKKGGGNDECAKPGCFAALYNRLIKSEDFKRLFLHHSTVMWEKYLNSSKVAKTIDAMTATIPSSEMDRDLAKFERDYVRDFDRDGSHLKKWASERDDKVLNEYKSQFFNNGEGSGELVEMTISSEGSGAVLMEGMKLPGSTATSTSYKGKFFDGMEMELTAVAAGGSVFKEWSDGSTDNPHKITVKSNLTITAKFK